MINRCPELGANYGMICFVFFKVIQLSNRLTFPPVSEPKVIKTKTENRTTMTTTGGDDGASAGQLVISRQMRNDMLVDLLAAGSHGDSVTLEVWGWGPGFQVT